MALFATQFGLEPVANILLVEDDPDDQMLFCLAAQKTRLSLSIQSVSNGQEALDYLEGKPPFDERRRFPLPDVVVLDLKLPLLDGFGFLRRVRTSPCFGALPIIAVTGSLHDGWQEEVQALGANGYFEKPSRLETLSRLIRQIWEGALGAPGSMPHCPEALAC